ncbi:MAG: DNA-formamidopyrimidine glycosylase family protein [Pseudonocardiales bacterium]
MPEGDTVYLTAKRLHEALAGEPVIASDFRVPHLATADVAGRTVLEVVPRGKHLLMRFNDARTLHTHLRMDGSWQIYAADGPWRRPAHHARVVLRTRHRQAVGFRVHDIALLPTAEEAGLVGHLGPDLLDPAVDLEEAVRRLVERPDREIAPALLDQGNLAGIGNLYKSEVLFLRGLSPWAAVRGVPDVPAVVRLARRLLVANKDRWEQITTGETAPGRQHWVFERSGRPCRRCGTTIRSAEQGDPPYQRLSYWCPHCQPRKEVVDPGDGRSSPV